jgi:rhodanese-related sulfurtransferase
MDLKVSSTIGFERAHNPVLEIDDEDAFVRAALATLGPQPPNFRNIVEVNRGPLLQDGAEAHPLAPRQVERRRSEGALLVDVRTELQFDDAHIDGSVCITALRAGFGTNLAWIADPAQDVVFVGRDDADGRRAAALAGAVGVTRVAGYLHGGMTAWREEKGRVRSTRRVSVPELHELWGPGGAVQVLDVRERSEWDGGHIPGAVHVPYHDLDELPGEIDPAAPLAVICASGQRAAVAASLAQRHGAEDVWHVVDGGVGTWGRAGFELERPA